MARVTIRRALFWFEAAVALLLGLAGGWTFLTAALEPPRHGQALVCLMGILLLLSAAAFGVGAWALRSDRRAAWLVQVFPGLVTVWVLWDLLSHL